MLSLSNFSWRSSLGYVGCLAAGIAFYFSGVGDAPDRQWLDMGFGVERAYYPLPAANDVVVVGIDEAFLRDAPEPFALLHRQMADLFIAVAAAKPRAVGLDIVLPEKSFSFLVPADQPDFDFDRALARGLLTMGAAAPVVVGETWDQARGRFRDIHPAFLAAAGRWVNQRGMTFDHRGSALVCPDADGVVREYPDAHCQPGGGTRTLTERIMALLDRGDQWAGYINYGIGGEFSYVPARTLIEWQHTGNKAQLSKFAGKLVLVGAILDDEDRLKAPIPLAQWEPGNHRVPGVLLHAQILRSLTNTGLVQPVGAPWMMLGIAVGAAFWFGVRFRLKLVLLFGFMILILVASLWLLRSTVFLAPLAIVATAAFAFAASGVSAAQSYWRERQYLTRTFSGFVSPQVLKGILSGTLSPDKRGQKRRVCVLFSDIRDFTTLSEQLAPDAVVDLLNRYFDRMAKIVHANGGSVDKYIGDGMMALFGAPQPLACPEKNALEAAQAMLLALVELNIEFRTLELPELRVGIGIHTGEAVIGHIGSSERHEYTAIGDAVNVAARVADLPKRLGAPIVCTAPVAEAVGHPPFLHDAGLQALKGHTDMRVYIWNPDILEANGA